MGTPQVSYGSVASRSETTKGKRSRSLGQQDLHEDIWCHIHSLLPIRDSARAASVSRTFLRSWRYRPNLILSEETLGLEQIACGEGDIARALTDKIDQILKNHSRTGVKTLELDIFGCRDLDTCYLDNWLQVAITPAIEKLTLSLPSKCQEGYSFPCSLLFGQNGGSIQYLHLTRCAFHPTVGIGCFRNLTELYLGYVRITGQELGCLLSNSLALMQLELKYCSEIICLKIPCMLEQLSSLTVSDCSMLQMIESQAPNLTTFDFEGDNLVQLSLQQSLQVNDVDMQCSEENFLCYAITKLPYMLPNLESLTLSSSSERVNTPMAPAKFLHLEYLEIYFDGDPSPGYDYLSLLSFLDASPVLETFVLRVHQFNLKFDSIFESASHLRQMPEHKHGNLKDFSIFGFCSAKSMVELTCHIIESATSLECITLDSVFDQEDDDDLGRCCLTSARKTGACWPLSDEMMLEAHKGLKAIERYIVGKIPSTVKLDVRRPCSQCHP
ncbi:hypothetical protein BAE44_0001124 [Dichanthelium oligosanthes]|uniref:At1g61320/AtMIF1 LRR domain-containing protein n=1 Tax=Dichanthelium oligosanthes TaxID=888268 RepID=A0A1E5WKI0_9POAL|nr:hypothetical protein BAE44_0001124 [Dichanthelium oligosanthes]